MSDPNFGNVSLLLHMDGSNGSTTFTDSSSNAFTVTPNGNAQISTTQSKFGGASAYFDGNGDFLSVSDNDAFNLGSGDFTIEGWVYVSGGSGDRAICSQWTQAGNNLGYFIGMNTNGYLAFYYSTNGSSGVFSAFTSGFGLGSATWTHFCAERSGNTLRLYINGTARYTNTSFTATLYNSTANFVVGAANGASFCNGYIDDLRVTKGVARYSGNFSIPTSAYPDLSVRAGIMPICVNPAKAFINRIHHQGL